jgi:hypothetical protein
MDMIDIKQSAMLDVREKMEEKLENFIQNVELRMSITEGKVIINNTLTTQKSEENNVRIMNLRVNEITGVKQELNKMKKKVANIKKAVNEKEITVHSCKKKKNNDDNSSSDGEVEDRKGELIIESNDDSYNKFWKILRGDNVEIHQSMKKKLDFE